MTGKQAHTAGSWFWDGTALMASRPGRASRFVLVTRCAEANPAQADALMIAAAPQMYAVLYAMFREGPVDVALAGNPRAVEALKAEAFAALDKAEGVRTPLAKALTPTTPTQGADDERV